MTNIAQALVQLKAFARQDGAILWLLWTASFVGLIIDPAASWGSLFAFLTPFIVGWRLIKFRDEALDGAISFRRGYAYCWYVFFYGALLFAIEQYLYFCYLDNGTFATNVEIAEAPGNERMELAEKLLYMQRDLSDDAKRRLGAIANRRDYYSLPVRAAPIEVPSEIHVSEVINKSNSRAHDGSFLKRSNEEHDTSSMRLQTAHGSIVGFQEIIVHLAFR